MIRKTLLVISVVPLVGSVGLWVASYAMAAIEGAAKDSGHGYTQNARYGGD